MLVIGEHNLNGGGFIIWKYGDQKEGAHLVQVLKEKNLLTVNSVSGEIVIVYLEEIPVGHCIWSFLYTSGLDLLYFIEDVFSIYNILAYQTQQCIKRIASSDHSENYSRYARWIQHSKLNPHDQLYKQAKEENVYAPISWLRKCSWQNPIPIHDTSSQQIRDRIEEVWNQDNSRLVLTGSSEEESVSCFLRSICWLPAVLGITWLQTHHSYSASVLTWLCLSVG